MKTLLLLVVLGAGLGVLGATVFSEFYTAGHHADKKEDRLK